MKSTNALFILTVVLIGSISAFGNEIAEHVTFPTEDGGTISADLYGMGERAILLTHGGQFNKKSWEKQAHIFMKSGFRVLAMDFRGYGESTGPGQADPMSAPLHLDVLAGVRYLRKTGAKTVSIVGGSMGGTAAATASIQAKSGEIDRIVLLGAACDCIPEKLKVRKLFIVSRDDTRGDGVVRLTKIREQFEKSPEPKKFVILEGSAHAQALFETDQAEKLMNEILQFLSAP